MPIVDKDYLKKDPEIIKCMCNNCLTNFDLKVSVPHFCANCFGEILRKNNNPTWFKQKKFAYFVLIFFPLVWIIGLKFGFIFELMWVLGMIHFIVGIPLTNWLAEKF